VNVAVGVIALALATVTPGTRRAGFGGAVRKAATWPAFIS
jgi:hypothetical protein